MRILAGFCVNKKAVTLGFFFSPVWAVSSSLSCMVLTASALRLKLATNSPMVADNILADGATSLGLGAPQALSSNSGSATRADRTAAQARRWVLEGGDVNPYNFSL